MRVREVGTGLTEVGMPLLYLTIFSLLSSEEIRVFCWVNLESFKQPHKRCVLSPWPSARVTGALITYAATVPLYLPIAHTNN